MLLVGVVALLISLFVPPSLFWLTYFVGTVFASSWAPVAFMSVWSDRITADAAFWGIVSGFVANIFPKFLDTMGWIDLPVYLDPILIGGVISLFVVLWLSRLGTVTDEERSFRLQLHEIPTEERNEGQVKKTRWAAIMLVAFGVSISTLLLTFYVRPYQSSTDTLRGGLALDWFTGEALHAAGWTVLFATCGILAHRVIRRSCDARGVGKA